MSIKKIKWPTLMGNLNASRVLSPYLSDFTSIDNSLKEYMEATNSPLSDLATLVSTFLTSLDTNKWKDLDIYLSSFREYDDRFILLLSNKMREYITFYKKVLEDEGVQRHLVYSKNYSASGSASSNERGINSVTPQNSNLYDSEHPESDELFDEAIANYASNIDKNKASSTTSSSGNSATNVTGTTWDEQKKNLQMLFFNELKDYIMSIPERIYSYYSLETIPAPELYKKMIENIIQTMDIIHE